jgi:predicted dehydrogenase
MQRCNREHTILGRRSFVKSGAGLAATLALPTIVPASALGRNGRKPPSERIVMGVIGTGGRGTHDMRWLLNQSDIQFTAVCDVQKKSRERARQIVNEAHKNEDCSVYRDFRELLAKEREIEAVLIAAGDRWHAPLAIKAMQAGKDVYCEKPGTLTIAEGQALVRTERATKRIFQTGAQRMSEANYVFAGELLRQGMLGEIQTLRAHLGYLPAWPRVNAKLPAMPTPPPEELDWDMWIGPSPFRPYNARFLKPWPPPGWYSQYDFAGAIPQWGSHTIAQCQLDMGLAETSAVDYEYPEGGINQAKSMTIRFANNTKLVAQLEGWRGSCGVRYEGSEGWVETADGYERPDVSDPALFKEYRRLVDGYKQRTGRTLNHLRDFLDCVRSRRSALAHTKVAHRTMSTNLIMDIALDLQRSLRWDPQKEEFIDDEQANQLRSRVMRAPWQIV